MKWFFLENDSKVCSVAVVGAGVAGIQVAKILIDSGFKVKIFEKNEEIGGVWLKGYQNLHLQTPKANFKIPNHEYRKSLKNIDYPNREEILIYLQDYARKNNLYKWINLNCDLKEIESYDKKISLIYFDINKTEQREDFDFVVLSQGIYNKPNIPDIFDKNLPGNIVSNYHGKIIHSTEIKDYLKFKNKNVVIVGYSKSAIDLASNISNYSDKLTVITRHLSWPIPQYFFNNRFLIPYYFHRRFFNDFISDQMIYSGWFHRFWHNHFSFVRNFIIRMIEIPIDNQFNLTKLKIKPDENMSKNFLHHRGFTASNDFFHNIEQKRIEVIKGEIESLHEKKIVINSKKFNNDYTEINDVDYIILCTGFKDSILPLFRFTLDFRIPNVAFIGNYTSSMYCLNIAIQSLWLVKFLKKQIKFTIEEMKEDVEINKKLNESIVKKYKIKNPKFDMVNAIAFNDLLLTDMKINSRRKFFFDSIRRYRVEDYENLFMK